MTAELFQPAQSLFHTWDARWKCIGIGGLALAGSAASDPRSLCILPVSALLTVVVARVPAAVVFRSLRFPAILLLLMLPLMALTGGGDGLHWGSIALSRLGLQAAGAVAVRALSIMLLLVALFASTRLQTLTAGLAKMGLPTPLAAVLQFTYRYIGLYSQDMARMRTAARLRGMGMRSKNNLRTAAGMMLTLLIRSYEQSERVHSAMMLRGYCGRFVTTRQFRTRPTDPVLTGVFLLLATTIMLMEVV